MRTRCSDARHCGRAARVSLPRALAPPPLCTAVAMRVTPPHSARGRLHTYVLLTPHRVPFPRAELEMARLFATVAASVLVVAHGYGRPADCYSEFQCIYEFNSGNAVVSWDLKKLCACVVC